jgi:hypothetical protein
MKKIGLILIGLAGFTAACALVQPKSVVDVYYRGDLNTQTSKVIVFPLLDLSGKKVTGARNVEMSLLSKWADAYGKENIIPAGPVIEQLAGNANFMEFIKSLDNTSAVEQLHQNPRIREVLSAITDKLGNYNIAVALIDGGSQDFESGKQIHLNIGYFDTKNLTWKWITKTSTVKGKLGKWELSANGMVNDSFKEIKARNKAQ